MRKQIRHNVFETNSSSVHSLVYANGNLEPSELNMDGLGVIHISLGDFGKSYHVYKRQSEKLSYLLTCVYYLADCDAGNIYSHFEFDKIQRAICSYTGARAIEIDNSEGYIDHQSVPYDEISIIDTNHQNEIINYVFNKDVWLETDCD